MNERAEYEFSRGFHPQDTRKSAAENDAEIKNRQNRRAIDSIVTQLTSFEFKMIDLNVERRLVTDLSEDSIQK